LVAVQSGVKLREGKKVSKMGEMAESAKEIEIDEANVPRNSGHPEC
jgi:hypothetical protein